MKPQNIFVSPYNTWRDLSESDKWNNILSFSKTLLIKCDWTQLPDNGLSILKRLEWQGYRDSLRAIQDDFINPDDVIFPTEPTE